MQHMLKMAGRRILSSVQSCPDLTEQIPCSSLPHTVVLHMLVCYTIIIVIVIYQRYLFPSPLISSHSLFIAQ